MSKEDMVQTERGRWSNDLRGKIVLIIIEVVILGSTSFLLKQEYESLRTVEAVKWISEDIDQGVKRTQDLRRQTITIHKFGTETFKDVRMLFKIEHPEDYEILNTSLDKYEKALSNIFVAPKTYDVQGSTINEEGEKSDSTYRYRLDELSPKWVYELKLDIRSKRGKPIEKYGYFQLRNRDNARIGNEGLSAEDNLRLYMNAVLIAGLAIIVFIIVIVWIVGMRFV